MINKLQSIIVFGCGMYSLHPHRIVHHDKLILELMSILYTVFPIEFFVFKLLIIKGAQGLMHISNKNRHDLYV